LWLSKKESAQEQNRWFTPENIEQSLDQWQASLQPEHVGTWLQAYGDQRPIKDISVGIIMAGNIPLVGMHDLLCCLTMGCRVVVKTSSDDDVLTRFWLEQAIEILPELKNQIGFSDNFKEVHAAIATGSNNSARYFEYYFRNKPHLLRKNRNSLAVLNGEETTEALQRLGHDVFDYFGLGCRNVTHLLLPESYEFRPLFETWESFHFVLDHSKYYNNYHYHKALLLMNLDPHMDTGFLLLKEKQALYSPVGMLNYSFYSDIQEARDYILNQTEGIQCITSDMAEITHLKLGESQKTMLWDYADGKDTMKWLQELITQQS
jgi:hypothetical protein